ncbi:F-box/kelch-repeat protein-like protein, partial [Drosera capensis]
EEVFYSIFVAPIVPQEIRLHCTNILCVISYVRLAKGKSFINRSSNIYMAGDDQMKKNRMIIPGLIDDVGRECLLRIPYDSFPSTASVSTFWAGEIRSREFHQHRKSLNLSQPVIILSQAIGQGRARSEKGDDSVSPSYRLVIYEPVTKEWKPMLPAIPGSKPGILPMLCGVVGVGTEIVVIGGWDPDTWAVSCAVHVFSFLNGEWRRGADLPGPPRSFFGCAADGGARGRVMVAGGHDVEKNALRSAVMYDVAEDRWESLPDMAKERDECKVVFHRGRFHVIGGYCTDTQGRFDPSLELFDSSNGRWDQVEINLLGSDYSAQLITCVTDANMEGLYTCRDGNVARLEGDKWHDVAEVPGDVGTSLHMTAWRDSLMVIGSAKFEQAHKCYVLDLKRNKWVHLDLPSEFCGHVQSGCTLAL